MLGYIGLIALIYLSFKLSFQLTTHKQVFQEYGIPPTKVYILQASSLLYILSLVGFTLPFSWLDLFRPIPIGFLLLLPGIIIGKKISNTMDLGLQGPAAAGRVASNVMWLGIGTGIFIAGNIIVFLIFSSLGSDFPI